MEIAHKFRFDQYYAWVILNASGKSREIEHKPLWWEFMNFLSQRGFEVFKDIHIEKNFKSLSDTHHQGKKGDLEFKSNVYPAGFKIEFYQNIVFENQNGGEYDFDKFDKMPYLVKKSFINETSHIKKFLLDHEVGDNSDPITRTSEEKVLRRVIEYRNTHMRSDPIASLAETIGHSPDQTYNHLGRDKKRLFNGDVKYIRDHKGYLKRGTVYHNINNMWWIIFSHSDYTNVGSHKLFDCIPSQVNRKEHPRRGSILEALKEKAAKQNDFEKAIIIRDILKHEAA